MTRLYLFASLSLLFTLTAQAESEKTVRDWVLGISLNLGLTSLDVHDAYDRENYVGSFEGGFGVGGQALLFHPISERFQVGGNFDWIFSSHSSLLYDIAVFQPSVGPAVRFTLEAIDLTAYVNFSFGWVSSEGLTSCSKIVCPGGDFNRGMSGTILGIRAFYSISDQFGLGPYFMYSSQAMHSVPYKFLDNGRYRDLEADIGVKYSQYGISLIWYPL